MLGWKGLVESGLDCLLHSTWLEVDWIVCWEVLGWKWIGLFAGKCLGARGLECLDGSAWVEVDWAAWLEGIG